MTNGGIANVKKVILVRMTESNQQITAPVIVQYSYVYRCFTFMFVWYFAAYEYGCIEMY